ncbi:MAG: hypothetical protein HYU60_01630 [Magnetospirillum sp.]|nr:hypothetical protein [Magnetospirillum sp.]
MRTFGAWVLAGVLAVAGAELAAWAAVAMVEARAPYLFYRVPNTPRATYENYLLHGNRTDLGWAGRGADFDEAGGRLVPAFPKPGGECASVYGDSFAFGVGLAPTETWVNQLSLRLGCRVANWGEPGYAVDQAVLRFLGNGQERPRIAVLAIWPEDILRSLNRWQYLIAASGEYSFKPRFVLEGGQLHLVPTPQFDWPRYQTCSRRPEDCLDHETFLPDSADGPARIGFPHLRTALRVLTGARVTNYLAGRVSWAAFLDETHPSGARPLMRALIGRFAAEAAARGAAPLVVVFPTIGSQRVFEQGKGLATQPLLDDLAALGIPHADLHQPLAHLLGGRPFCDILDGKDQCGGHFNADGAAMVAEILAPKLADMLAGSRYSPPP